MPLSTAGKHEQVWSGTTPCCGDDKWAWRGRDEVSEVNEVSELSEEGFEKMMKENDLDAMLTLGVDVSTVLAIGGYPALTVPAGYDSKGKPFGICFGGLKGMEPKLIEVAYAFEQATLSRKAPPSLWT
jgi:amidase